MIEFVIVKYREERIVFIDGKKAGITGKTLLVNTGTHTFSLGGAQDFKPPVITRQVVGTTPVKPMEVTFEKA